MQAYIDFCHLLSRFIRAALLTGRYQVRAGVLHGFGAESLAGL